MVGAGDFPDRRRPQFGADQVVEYLLELHAQGYEVVKEDPQGKVLVLVLDENNEVRFNLHSGVQVQGLPPERDQARLRSCE